MKVLYVDQLAKTSGCYSIPQSEYIFQKENIEIQEYISDNIDFKLEKYSVPIIKGFHGAYEGSAINKAKNYMQSLKELKKYIINNKIDILHLQWFSLPWIEWRFVSKMKKICKVVITIHDVIPFNCRPLEMRSLDAIYRNADYLLFHTKYAKKEFEKYYKTRVKTKIITQGFCSKNDYRKLDNIIAKEHFGIPKDKTVFLYYGTIRQSKGLDILLKAIHEAYKSDNRVFLLAGGAFQKVNEDEYRKLTDMCVNVDNSIINFGFVPSEEEAWYFSAADVICLPYREITQSGVAQTALMYELPIIATNIGDMKEVVREGFNGELFTVDDKNQLAELIIKMTRKSELIGKYSAGSKYLAENEFSLEKKSKAVADVYREVISL